MSTAETRSGRRAGAEARRAQRCDYRDGLIQMPNYNNPSAFDEWDGFVRNEHTRTREERSVTGSSMLHAATSSIVALTLIDSQKNTCMGSGLPGPQGASDDDFSEEVFSRHPPMGLAEAGTVPAPGPVGW